MHKKKYRANILQPRRLIISFSSVNHRKCHAVGLASRNIWNIWNILLCLDTKHIIQKKMIVRSGQGNPFETVQAADMTIFGRGSEWALNPLMSRQCTTFPHRPMIHSHATPQARKSATSYCRHSVFHEARKGGERDTWVSKPTPAYWAPNTNPGQITPGVSHEGVITHHPPQCYNF